MNGKVGGVSDGLHHTTTAHDFRLLFDGVLIPFCMFFSLGFASREQKSPFFLAIVFCVFL